MIVAGIVLLGALMGAFFWWGAGIPRAPKLGNGIGGDGPYDADYHDYRRAIGK